MVVVWKGTTTAAPTLLYLWSDLCLISFRFVFLKNFSEFPWLLPSAVSSFLSLFLLLLFLLHFSFHPIERFLATYLNGTCDGMCCYIFYLYSTTPSFMIYPAK